jgi:MtN3 and saliva related transmembrane protein
MDATTLGFVAGFLTTAAWLPQIVRVWRLRRADEISWGYLGAFGVGISCWLSYGFVTRALAIIVANAVTLVLLGSLAAVKLLSATARGARHAPGGA